MDGGESEPNVLESVDVDMESDPGLVMNIDKENPEANAGEALPGNSENIVDGDECVLIDPNNQYEKSPPPLDPEIEVRSEEGSETGSLTNIVDWVPVIVEPTSEQGSEVGDPNSHPNIEILEVDSDVECPPGEYVQEPVVMSEDEDRVETTRATKIDGGEDVKENTVIIGHDEIKDGPKNGFEAGEHLLDNCNDDIVKASLPQETTSEPEVQVKLEVEVNLKNDSAVEEVKLLSNPDVFLYEVHQGLDHQKRKASDWNLQEPIWSGTLHLCSREGECVIKLEDDEGNLFGKVNVERFPGNNICPVSDSTRFFILRVFKTDGDEQLVGLGFSQRKDSADFMWALQNLLQNLFNPQRNLKEKDRTEKANLSKKMTSDFLMDSTPPIAEQTKFLPEPPPVKTESGSSHIFLTPTGDLKDFIKTGLPQPGIFSCHLCSAYFDDMRHIKSHWYQVHKLRHPAHCVKCKKPFPTVAMMSKHRKQVHGHKCPACGDSFKSPKALQDHYLARHGGKLEFACPLCFKKFKSRAEVKNHIEKSQCKNGGSSILKKCPDCDQSFLEQTDLDEHMSTHLKYIFCHLCDAGFSSRSEIRKHMITAHDGAPQLRL